MTKSETTDELSENKRTFEGLACWQACREIRTTLRKEVLAHLPPDERFRLSDQIIRAARSTTANIAEGYGRFHFLDNAKFCRNARASLFELIDHIIAALDEGYISKETASAIKCRILDAVKILNGYIRYLVDASKTSKDPKPTT